MMEEFELTMRLRNNLLKRRRVELGLSPKDMAAKIGIGYGRYLEFENLRFAPYRNGAWLPSALRVADYFKAAPEDLWPDTVLTVSNPVVSAEVAADKLSALAAFAHTLESPRAPDELLADAELATAIDVALDGVTDHERHVVRMRMNGMGFNEIGEQLHLTSQRVIQIYNRALFKLRQPEATKLLKPFHQDDYVPLVLPGQSLRDRVATMQAKQITAAKQSAAAAERVAKQSAARAVRRAARREAAREWETGLRRAVAVFGSPDWDDKAYVYDMLDSLRPGLVVCGARPTGAEYYARKWCAQRGVPCEVVSADWDTRYLVAVRAARRLAKLVKSGCMVSCEAFLLRSGDWSDLDGVQQHMSAFSISVRAHHQR